MTLAQMGVSEPVARSHSMEWVRDACKAVVQERMHWLALRAQAVFTATSAAFNGEAAKDQFDEFLDHLTRFGEDEDDVAVDELRLAELDYVTGSVPVYEREGAA